MAVARLNVSDGSLDTTFDADGTVTTSFGAGSSLAEDLVVDTKGRIVVVGNATGSNLDFAVARYRTDGSLDPFFDGDSGTGDGKVLVPFGAANETAFGVALEADGDIVLAGETGSTTDGALARSARSRRSSPSPAFTTGRSSASGYRRRPSAPKAPSAGASRGPEKDRMRAYRGTPAGVENSVLS